MPLHQQVQVVYARLCSSQQTSSWFVHRIGTTNLTWSGNFGEFCIWYLACNSEPMVCCSVWNFTCRINWNIPWVPDKTEQALSSCWDGRPFQSKVGKKVGGMLCPFPWGGSFSHLTQCGLGQGLLPCHVASWSTQRSRIQTGDRYRQDRQRTVSQMVAQKCCRWLLFLISFQLNKSVDWMYWNRIIVYWCMFFSINTTA